MKNITILGVTGSIGQQTVDVCLHHQDEFNVVAMSAGKNIVLLETTIQKSIHKLFVLSMKRIVTIFKKSIHIFVLFLVVLV